MGETISTTTTKIEVFSTFYVPCCHVQYVSFEEREGMAVENTDSTLLLTAKQMSPCRNDAVVRRATMQLSGHAMNNVSMIWRIAYPKGQGCEPGLN